MFFGRVRFHRESVNLLELGAQQIIDQSMSLQQSFAFKLWTDNHALEFGTTTIRYIDYVLII